MQVNAEVRGNGVLPWGELLGFDQMPQAESSAGMTWPPGLGASIGAKVGVVPPAFFQYMYFSNVGGGDYSFYFNQIAVTLAEDDGSLSGTFQVYGGYVSGYFNTQGPAAFVGDVSGSVDGNGNVTLSCNGTLRDADTDNTIGIASFDFAGEYRDDGPPRIESGSFEYTYLTPGGTARPSGSFGTLYLNQ